MELPPKIVKKLETQIIDDEECQVEVEVEVRGFFFSHPRSSYGEHTDNLSSPRCIVFILLIHFNLGHSHFWHRNCIFNFSHYYQFLWRINLLSCFRFFFSFWLAIAIHTLFQFHQATHTSYPPYFFIIIPCDDFTFLQRTVRFDNHAYYLRPIYVRVRQCDPKLRGPGVQQQRKKANFPKSNQTVSFSNHALYSSMFYTFFYFQCNLNQIPTLGSFMSAPGHIKIVLMR